MSPASAGRLEGKEQAMANVSRRNFIAASAATVAGLGLVGCGGGGGEQQAADGQVAENSVGASEDLIKAA